MDIDRAYGVDGVEVVWSKSLIPAVLAPLRLVVASYGCLLRITDLSKVEQAFATVVEKSMAALYSVSRGLEKEFVSRTKAGGAPRHHDFGMKQDPAYFIYMVDADSVESATGLYEIVSMGREASECLQEVFADYLASPPSTEPPAPV